MSNGSSAERSRGGDVRRAFLLAIAALMISVGAGAQSDTASDTDSIGPVFRGIIDSVAAVASYGSLRDGRLASGTRREGRIYIGFGLGYPQEAEDANERAAARIMESIEALYSP